MTDQQPITRRVPPPDPPANEVRFVAELAVAPLDLPKPVRVDPLIEKRRAKAEHLCLWLGCARVLCRRSRHCHGRGAPCVFEQNEVRAPLLG